MKTNTFTNKQLKQLKDELKKVSSPGLKRAAHTRADYIEVEVKRSPYTVDAFLSFLDITDPDYPRYKLYKIDENGNIDYDARANMDFTTLADRVNFFNTLTPVKL